MIAKEIKLEPRTDLPPAPPVTWFIIQVNQKFQSKIWIEKRDRRANAKDLASVINLFPIAGSKLRIYADGSDEQKVLDEIEELLIPYTSLAEFPIQILPKQYNAPIKEEDL